MMKAANPRKMSSGCFHQTSVRMVSPKRRCAGSVASAAELMRGVAQRPLCYRAVFRVSRKSWPRFSRDARRDHDRIAHSVQQFLIGRDNRGERAAQHGASILGEVIRTEPHPAAHRLQLVSLTLE